MKLSSSFKSYSSDAQFELLEQRLLLADPTMTVVTTPLLGATEDTAYTLTFAALDAETDAADADLDFRGYRIESVVSGSITVGGAAVVPGTTVLDAVSGDLVWTPAQDANGNLDAFTMVAIDDLGGVSAPALTVTVTTAAVQDAPTMTLVNTVPGATEDTPFTLTYAALDAQTDADDADGDPISYRIESVVAGTLTKGGVAVVPGVTLLATGESLVWTPAANANGNINAFTIVAWDGTAASASAKTVTIQTAGTNDLPTMTTVNTLVGASEDTAFTISWATLDAATDAADIDGDGIRYRVQAVSTGTLTKGGVAVVPGSTNIASGESFVWTPASNQNGDLNAFTIVAYDGTGVSAPVLQVVVTVAAVNDAPTLTTMTTLGGATEDTPFTITYADLTGAGNAADVEGDTINFRVQTVTNGTLTMGGIPVTPGVTTLTGASADLVWTPAANDNGVLSAFTVVATDGTGVSNPAVAVQVDTAAVNDAPTMTAFTGFVETGTEDTPFTITYDMINDNVNSADVDGDTLSYRIEAVTTGTLTQNGIAVIPGVTELTESGASLVWTPAENANGALGAFTIVAYDGTDVSAVPVTITVSVDPVNDAPTMTTVTALTGALSGEEYEITYADLLAASDAADVDGDTLTFTLEELFIGTFYIDDVQIAAGATLGTGQTLVWVPPVQSGTLKAFSVTVTDGVETSSPNVKVYISTGAKITSAAPFTFTDNDNDTVTVTILGPGYVVLFVDDADSDGKGSMEALELVNTDVYYSKITIGVVRGLGGDNVIEIGEITGDGAYSITARQSELNGLGLDIDGYVNTLWLGDVLDGADISVVGHPSGNTILRAGVIADGTDITSDTRLDMYVTSYGVGTITAPAIGVLQTKANKKIFDFGNFDADLTLTGTVFAPQTLRQVSIAGNVNGSTWDITGDMGAITILGTIDNASGAWTLLADGDITSLRLGQVSSADATVTGRIGSLTAKDWEVGSIQAETIGTMTMTGARVPLLAGDFLADLTLTGATGLLTFGTITVAGAIDGLWTIDGDAGTVIAGSTAATWMGGFDDGLTRLQARRTLSGTVDADNIRYLTATTIDNADITLTDTPADGAYTIERVTVNGWIADSRILSSGNIGWLNAKGMDTSDVYAGIDPIVVGLPILAANFINTSAISNVNIAGVKVNKVYVDSYINSNIAAYTLGTAPLLTGKPVYSVKVNYADTTNGGTSFGLSAREVLSIYYMDSGNTLSAPDINLGDFKVIEVV